jgi:hypothetical protein
MRHFGAPLFTFCYQKLRINPFLALLAQGLAYQSGRWECRMLSFCRSNVEECYQCSGSAATAARLASMLTLR